MQANANKAATATKKAAVKAAPKQAPATVKADQAALVMQPATAPAPATTAPAPAKPSAADKRAAYNDAQAKAAKLYAILAATVVSIPVKPATFKANALNHKARSLSQRGAAAIYLAVTASGKPLADGGTYARTFDLNGTGYRIENGAFSDFADSVYTVDSSNGLGSESFTLTTGATAAIKAQLGAAIAKLDSTIAAHKAA